MKEKTYSEPEYIRKLGSFTDDLEFRTVDEIRLMLTNYIRRSDNGIHIAIAKNRLVEMAKLDGDFCPYRKD